MHAPARQRRRLPRPRLPKLPRLGGLSTLGRFAGRRGLPVALIALAAVAGASTNAPAARITDAGGPPLAAGTTLPPVVPPTWTPGGSTQPGTPLGSSPASDRAAAPGGSPAGEAAQGLTTSGIPAVAKSAYEAAAAASGCGAPWTLLAAIGRVESNHGRFAGATLLADGRSDPPIVGIPLDGRPGVARITDSDGGKYDGDTTYDRAVGPMQFIPGTWALFEADGDRDGKSDPFNLHDAAAAAAEYLCRAGGDLSTDPGQQNAVFSYNRSDSYVRLVLDLSAQYALGAPVDGLPAPDRTPRPLPPPVTPTLPPVAVGDPPAASPTTTRPKPKPTTPRPTTPKPTKPAPTTTRPAPTTTPPTGTPSPSPSPTTTAPTPTPTCTPAPTPSGSTSPTPTGSVSPTPTPSPTTPSPTPSGSATGTPTPSPTLPTCPTATP